MYIYVLHGGTPRPEYVEIILMRELGLKPWEIEQHLSAGQVNDYLACLQGEAKARKVQQEQARNG